MTSASDGTATSVGMAVNVVGHRGLMAHQPELWLARHGETEWSKSGQHTGTTDIPLTDNGRAAARCLVGLLSNEEFGLVLSSPMQRARETAELAGFGDVLHVTSDLCEWNYGDYEGIT